MYPRGVINDKLRMWTDRDWAEFFLAQAVQRKRKIRRKGGATLRGKEAQANIARCCGEVELTSAAEGMPEGLGVRFAHI